MSGILGEDLSTFYIVNSYICSSTIQQKSDLRFHGITFNIRISFAADA